VATLKHEQARINSEVAEAESQLAIDGEKLAQAKEIIDLALAWQTTTQRATRGRPKCPQDVEPGPPPNNRVRDGAVADVAYEEPFASLLGSHNGSMVMPGGEA
jgi:hypothetical protein